MVIIRKNLDKQSRLRYWRARRAAIVLLEVAESQGYAALYHNQELAVSPLVKKPISVCWACRTAAR
ncbi:MAG: hypothetical protein ACTXOO_02955 [Sodalis sp. (in: enterobacteria)]